MTAATKAATGNQLGIFEDLGDVYSQTDLDLFFAFLAPYAAGCFMFNPYANDLLGKSLWGLTQPSKPSMEPLHLTLLRLQGPNPIWISRFPILSSIHRIASYSNLMTLFMRPTILLMESSTPSLMRWMALTAAPSVLSILHTPIPVTHQVRSKANCNAVSTNQ